MICIKIYINFCFFSVAIVIMPVINIAIIASNTLENVNIFDTFFILFSNFIINWLFRNSNNIIVTIISIIDKITIVYIDIICSYLPYFILFYNYHYFFVVLIYHKILILTIFIFNKKCYLMYI